MSHLIFNSCDFIITSQSVLVQEKPVAIKSNHVLSVSILSHSKADFTGLSWPFAVVMGYSSNRESLHLTVLVSMSMLGVSIEG